MKETNNKIIKLNEVINNIETGNTNVTTYSLSIDKLINKLLELTSPVIYIGTVEVTNYKYTVDPEIETIVNNIPSIANEIAREERIATNNIVKLKSNREERSQKELREEWGLYGPLCKEHIDTTPLPKVPAIQTVELLIKNAARITEGLDIVKAITKKRVIEFFRSILHDKEIHYELFDIVDLVSYIIVKNKLENVTDKHMLLLTTVESYILTILKAKDPEELINKLCSIYNIKTKLSFVDIIPGCIVALFTEELLNNIFANL